MRHPERTRRDGKRPSRLSSPPILGELEDRPDENVRSQQEERDADPARERVVVAGVVLFLVGEEAQVSHGKKRRAALDRALDREGKEGEASGAESFVEPDTPFAEHVHEREPEEPVHPALEGARLEGRAGESGRGGNRVRHRAILVGGAAPRTCAEWGRSDARSGSRMMRMTRRGPARFWLLVAAVLAASAAFGVHRAAVGNLGGALEISTAVRREPDGPHDCLACRGARPLVSAPAPFLVASPERSAFGARSNRSRFSVALPPSVGRAPLSAYGPFPGRVARDLPISGRFG